MHKNTVFLLFCLLFASNVFAQQKFTVSGYVKDASSGETLIGASVYNAADPGIGTATNSYGFFSLTLDPGTYTLVFSFLGFDEKRVEVTLSGDRQLKVELEQGVVLKEVEIVDREGRESDVESTRMGTVDLQVERIKKLPVLLGEADVLKAIQLLPGVLSSGEGNAGFYVRGGGPDQNLVLLDEAVVYNSGHILGFFSVFNADAIKNTTLIKGGMPAAYGGRLSSVVDIQMKEGNDQHYEVTGGIGAIASRLTVEGPIVKDRSSFLVSARRTYAFDLAQPFLKGTAVEGTNYYFYDLNTKINYRFSDKDRLYLSGYFGRDVLNYVSADRGFSLRLPYGNATATLRWNHLFSKKMFLNVSAIFNNYRFSLSGEDPDFRLKVISGVRDFTGKADVDYFLSVQHQLKFGGQYTYHKLIPNIARAFSGDTELSNDLQPKYAHEMALYVQDEWQVSPALSVNIGLRGSAFSQVGPYTAPDSTAFAAGEPVRWYAGLEPRLTARYKLSPESSLKAGITAAYQYIHLVSNSNSTLPFDVWVPSSNSVRPQLGIQYALGYFRNFGNDRYEASVEAYYKDLRRQIDYRESFVNNPSTEVEQDFVFGNGRAYGLELFLKKREGRLNGWLGYTLARTERSFPDIEDGRTFPAVYDRTHDLSLVVNYKAGKKWDLGGVFVYGTGRTFTPIQSLFFIEQNLNINYGSRNSARLEAYHRMDLSATYTPNPDSDKRFQSSWTFSVYNAYNRQNPYFTYTDFAVDLEAGSAEATAYKVTLFPVIPSITWNFRWKERGG